MDSTIIAIAGTLGSVIIGVILGYVVQNKQAERQRKWSSEDQDRNRQDELEREQRRIKRELLSKRLEVVEETIKLMMRIIGIAVGEEIGLPIYDDKDAMVEIEKRIQHLTGEVWASIRTTGSEDLPGYWRQIARAYWAVMEEGRVEHEQWRQAQDACVEMFRLMDEMKSKV